MSRIRGLSDVNDLDCHGLLKAARQFIASLAHVPQRLQGKIFAKGVRLLQTHTHVRFSSRMMRSTIPRISSAEYGV